MPPPAPVRDRSGLVVEVDDVRLASAPRVARSQGGALHPPQCQIELV
jgi:hypothetical protein